MVGCFMGGLQRIQSTSTSMRVKPRRQPLSAGRHVLSIVTASRVETARYLLSNITNRLGIAPQAGWVAGRGRLNHAAGFATRSRLPELPANSRFPVGGTR